MRCVYTFTELFFNLLYFKDVSELKMNVDGDMVFTCMHSRCCLCICHLLTNVTFHSFVDSPLLAGAFTLKDSLFISNTVARLY